MATVDIMAEDGTDPNARRLRVAYVLQRFPSLTQTFILSEMRCLYQGGTELHIFSLRDPLPTPVHEQARMLIPLTRYSPFVSWPVVRAQLHFIVRSPRRYFRALRRTIWQTICWPRDLLLALAIFPKSVYYAHEMQRLHIEHIHAHFAWLQGIAAGIASDLLGITFTIHTHAFDLFTRNPRNLRCEMETATHLVTISRYNKDFILHLCPRLSPEDVDIVHCGIDADRFRSARSRTRDQLVHILSVGSLIEKKGHEYLIEACAILAERGYAFHCSIVGIGPLHQALFERVQQDHLNDHVTLVGALDQAQVLRMYQESDIFALACTVARSKDQDGIPVALMEAMACELPVVTTAVSGIPELVQHEQTGLVVPERDALGLANALELLVCDEDLRRQLGCRAREVVLQDFEIGANAARLARLFRKVSGAADEERLA